MSRYASLSVTGQARYGVLRSLIQRDFPPPARVVEFGSAPGDQIAALARSGYDATAVDLRVAEDEWDPGELRSFKRLLSDAGVESVVWDLDQVPFPLPDAAFDVAVLTEVLEHLREYPARSLADIRRVLRPRGRLYLTTPNAAYVMNRLRLLLGRSIYTPLRDWIDGPTHARHAREYTFGEIEQLLEHADFKIVSSSSRHFEIATGRASAPSRLAKVGLDALARRRRTLGPSILIVAERP
jgi:SAM-dependent methyltransferase